MMNIVQKIFAQPRNFLLKEQILRTIAAWLVFTAVSFTAWICVYGAFPPVSQFDFLFFTLMGYSMAGYSYSGWLKDLFKEPEVTACSLPVFLFVNALATCMMFVVIYLMRFYYLFLFD